MPYEKQSTVAHYHHGLSLFLQNGKKKQKQTRKDVVVVNEQPQQQNQQPNEPKKFTPSNATLLALFSICVLIWLPQIIVYVAENYLIPQEENITTQENVLLGQYTLRKSPAVFVKEHKKETVLGLFYKRTGDVSIQVITDDGRSHLMKPNRITFQTGENRTLYILGTHVLDEDHLIIDEIPERAVVTVTPEELADIEQQYEDIIGKPLPKNKEEK